MYKALQVSFLPKRGDRETSEGHVEIWGYSAKSEFTYSLGEEARW